MSNDDDDVDDIDDIDDADSRRSTSQREDEPNVGVGVGRAESEAASSSSPISLLPALAAECDVEVVSLVASIVVSSQYWTLASDAGDAREVSDARYARDAERAASSRV